MHIGHLNRGRDGLVTFNSFMYLLVRHSPPAGLITGDRVIYQALEDFLIRHVQLTVYKGILFDLGSRPSTITAGACLIRNARLTEGASCLSLAVDGLPLNLARLQLGMYNSLYTRGSYLSLAIDCLPLKLALLSLEMYN